MTSVSSATKVTPREMKANVKVVLKAGLVPYVVGSPGIGKSQIIRSIANEANLQMIDHRLSTSEPTDLSGMPWLDRERGKSFYAPFDIFPTVEMKPPEGKNGWLLFLDELNTAHRQTMAASYKLILDKMVGQHHLHPDVYMVCAGNRAEDRAIVNEIGSAMKTRVVHFEMEVSTKQWYEDVAVARKYDTRVMAYLNANPKELNRPNHEHRTFNCPRTWSEVNDLCSVIPLDQMERYAPSFSGCIEYGSAQSFISFSKLFNEMPKIKDILSDPEGCELGTSSDVRYIVMTILTQHIENDKEFKAIATYVKRHSSEYQVVFFRALAAQRPDLITHSEFTSAAVAIAREINADY